MSKKICLNEVISIEEAVYITDSTGCDRKKWSKVRDCRAKIKPLFNSSILISQHVTDKIASTNSYYEIVIRCSKDIKANMMIMWRRRSFNIIRCIEYNTRSGFSRIIVIENHNYA